MHLARARRRDRPAMRAEVFSIEEARGDRTVRRTAVRRPNCRKADAALLHERRGIEIDGDHVARALSTPLVAVLFVKLERHRSSHRVIAAIRVAVSPGPAPATAALQCIPRAARPGGALIGHVPFRAAPPATTGSDRACTGRPPVRRRLTSAAAIVTSFASDPC